MKNILLTIALALLCLTPLSAQDLDLRTLDRLGANAKSNANITLNTAMLRLGAAFLSSDGDSDAEAVKSLIGKLRAIYIRSYKYDVPGQYSEADLAPLRAMLSQPKWMAVVDVKEGKDTNQIYFLAGPNDKLAGVAVITLQPTKVNIVYIDGELDPADIAKLSGSMGIPEIRNLGEMKRDDNKNKKSK